MTMHISKRDAEAEAIRLAQAFLATRWAADSQARYTQINALPDRCAVGYRLRKTIIKYTVIFRPGPDELNQMEGQEVMIRVNIDNQEAEYV